LLRTLGVIKPDGMPHMDRILDAAWQSGFQITRMKMVRLERAEAIEFYREVRDDQSLK